MQSVGRSGVLWSVPGVMTAQSIGAGDAVEYARYLESKTIAPELGDYYLNPDGEPTQSPGRWLSSGDTLARLGIEGERIEGKDFIKLMEGRHPRSGEWLRRAGADGGRAGGIDVTFSPPKSVSAVWALGDRAQRADMEAAHAEAVSEALAHLTEVVPVVRRSIDGQPVEEPARDLIAAEYRHTTTRGVLAGDPPDPQLHSHIVITSAVREDGRIVAVGSARSSGRLARSARTIAPRSRTSSLSVAMASSKAPARASATSRSPGYHEGYWTRSQRAAARSPEQPSASARSTVGHPSAGSCARSSSRTAKRRCSSPAATCNRPGTESPDASTSPKTTSRSRSPAPGDRVRSVRWGDRVEERLTERAATFEPGEFRAVLLEQSAGGPSPREALAFSKTMIAERRVLPLEGGLMTTLAVRAQEQAIERRFTQLAIPGDREVGEAARAIASDQVAERISGRLSDEQAHALQIITGPERGAILVGPAGTGKGVVIDAAARAEQLTGHQTFGVAVSWSTAERLGRDSPALAESTFSIDALIARVQHGQLTVDQDTTIYLDEAGMADTARLDHLTEIIERTGAKLVAIGDSAQLPSIGAGGMFDRLAEIAPRAQLSNIRRTLDPAEQRAWADLRAGRSDKAMAHYHARGQLHMADTRDDAVEHAVQDWAKLTETHPIEEVALISDASNQEIHG